MSISTFGQDFDARSNSFDLLRLLLAVTVLVTHGLQLGYGWQPVWGPGSLYLGDLAVDGFFVVSGFLVARSATRLTSLGRFAWHRCLRILPGFWVCLLVTALIAAPLVAILQARSPGAAFTNIEQGSALRYIVVNSTTWIFQFGVADLFDGTAQPNNVNGALWSLGYETACYVILTLLALLGALRARPWLLWSAVSILVGLAAACEITGLTGPIADPFGRLTLLFLLGSLGWVHLDRVPAHGGLAALGLAAVIASSLTLDDYRVLGAVPFSYCCLWLAICSPLRWKPRVDLSYGLYIYHWPIIQILALVGLTRIGEVGFVAASLILSAGIATLSWYAVEKPALKQKTRGIPRRLADALGHPSADRPEARDTSRRWPRFRSL